MVNKLLCQIFGGEMGLKNETHSLIIESASRKFDMKEEVILTILTQLELGEVQYLHLLPQLNVTCSLNFHKTPSMELAAKDAVVAEMLNKSENKHGLHIFDVPSVANAVGLSTTELLNHLQNLKSSNEMRFELKDPAYCYIIVNPPSDLCSLATHMTKWLSDIECCKVRKLDVMFNAAAFAVKQCKRMDGCDNAHHTPCLQRRIQDYFNEEDHSDLCTMMNHNRNDNENEFMVERETYEQWDLFGLSKLQRTTEVDQSNIIIGLVDSGIRPNLPSFDDRDMEQLPIHRNWRGGSKVTDFDCNKKIVGAKVYNDDEEAPMTIYDDDGHGTMMALIVSGNYIDIGGKKSRGGCPNCRVAAYKYTSDQNVEKGILDSVSDGVDVLCVATSLFVGTTSLGKRTRIELVSFTNNPMASATLQATLKGIVCVASASNYGLKGTVANYCPWLLTVGAAQRNCKFATLIRLGDGRDIKGYSMNTFSSEYCSLIDQKDAFLWMSSMKLDPKKVQGKILIVEKYTSGDKAKEAGAKGMIIIHTHGCEIDSRISDFSLPAAIITKEDALSIKKYMDEQKKNRGEATAKILPCIEEAHGTNNDLPTLCGFSSRGSMLDQDIMKPNICAPGELFVPFASNSECSEGETPLRLTRGTSAATAFVSGVVGLIKTKHPDWSPDIIISAIMTTATPMRLIGADDVYGIGNGLINPQAAIDPGLVFELPGNDHIKYLRHHHIYCPNMPSVEVRKLLNTVDGSKRPRELNLPSLCAAFTQEEKSYVFNRSMKNIDKYNSEYEATIDPVEGLSVEVSPKTLNFCGRGRNQKFCVHVTVDWSKNGGKPISTYLEWRETRRTTKGKALNPKHIVRSRILITKKNTSWRNSFEI